MAQAAAPLIRPSATFSPRCAKGEGFTPARLGGSRSGVALVATLIMLSLVTFMVVAFLGVARRERRAIEAATTAGESQIARDAALNVAQADILARLLISGDKWNYGLMVSTNFQNTTNVTGTISPLNVNHTNALAAGVNPWLTNLGNLQYKPRPPVFSPNFTNTRAFPAPGSPINVLLSESRSGRFYLDFNRNGIFDPTDRTRAGDPHWIAQLEYPEVSHGPTNRFVSRYAYLIAPAGKAMDLNLIHNQAKRPATVNAEGYYRNLGLGAQEFNLAAMLTEMAPAHYGPSYLYDLNPLNVSGLAPFSRNPFRDALQLLLYRNNDSWNNHATLAAQFAATPAQFLTNASFDVLGDGPLMGSTNLTFNVDATNIPWPGGTNTSPTARRYFDFTELFSATRPNYQPFTTNLHFLSTNLANTLAGDTDRRAPYRLMEVLGTESWPVTNKLNLNWLNNPLGGTAGGEAFGFTNWSADTFFYSTAELMLRASLIPSVFVNTNWTGFGGAETNVLVTNYYFGTTFVGTNINSTLSVTNIPIFPFSYYLPETHRLLQFTANLFDATTWDGNAPAYPTVWRPVFGFANTNLWPSNDFVNIVGYTTNGTDAATLLSLPVYDLSDPNARMLMYTTAGGSIGASNLCLFAGTPVIMGAKKGYPNFNEFGVQISFSVTRRLEFIKSAATNAGPMAAVNPRPVQTNESLALGMTSIQGVEAWNSYSTPYPRDLRLLVTNIARIVVTNELGPVYTNVVTNGIAQNILASNWLGTAGAGTAGGYAAFRSFFFTNYPLSTNGLPASYFYSTNYPPLPGFTNGGFISAAPTPASSPRIFSTNGFSDLRLGITITNTLLFVLVDSNRVVDFVNLTNLNAGIDLASALRVSGPSSLNPGRPYDPRLALLDQLDMADLWATNRTGTAPFGITRGVSNQIAIGTNLITPNIQRWRSGNQSLNVLQQVDRFRRWMGLSGVPGLNPVQSLNTNIQIAQAPFSPSRTVVFNASWEVNDPLVHYTTRDITDPFRGTATNQIVPVWPLNTAVPPPGTIYRLDFGSANTYRPNGGTNNFYSPWGRAPNLAGVVGLPSPYLRPTAFDMRLKDPGAWSSDAWDFPQRKFANLGWIGRVHRGTPWQTFYLKSDIPNPTNWFYWAHSTDTSPTNDWRLVDVFTTAINADATRGLLSVNQTNSLAWAAALGGTLVLSNNGAALVPITIAPASLPLANLVGTLTNGLINAKQRIPMWQPMLNYSAGDLVAYFNGPFGFVNYFRALNGTNQNQNPFSQVSSNYFAYWTNLASWSATGIYSSGDLVERLGTSFYALSNSPAGPPEAVPQHWEPFPQRSFTKVGSILSTPELSVQSPFMSIPKPHAFRLYGNGELAYVKGWYYQSRQINNNRYPTDEPSDQFWTPVFYPMNDVAIERIPQQSLGLMHLEPHPRMVIYAYGQSLRPAERGVNVAPGTYSLMVTNYQVTGESAARAVVRIEGLPEPGLLPRPLPAGAPPVVTPRVFMESFKLLPEF